MKNFLDRNVLITANREYYGINICPRFWDWILENSVDGVVASVSSVAQKLQAGTDQLAQLSRTYQTTFFQQDNPNVSSSVLRNADWVESQSYTPKAIQWIVNSAHHMLITHATAEEWVVVTHEKPSNSRNKVKIPNVCEAFGIECWTPFEMLRREKARFVLGASE